MHIREVAVPSGGGEICLESGRALDGGIWVFGLCAKCNGASSEDDGAWEDLVDVAPRVHGPVLPGWRWTAPAAPIRPGAIARSLVMAMFGFNPRLGAAHPGWANNLLAGSPDTPPDGIRLRLALLSGDRAQVSGGASGMIIGPSLRTNARMVWATCHFRLS